MIEIPLVTEDDLWQMAKSELVNVAMRLQQLALLQEHQLELSQKLISLQQDTLDIVFPKNREGEE